MADQQCAGARAAAAVLREPRYTVRPRVPGARGALRAVSAILLRFPKNRSFRVGQWNGSFTCFESTAQEPLEQKISEKTPATLGRRGVAARLVSVPGPARLLQGAEHQCPMLSPSATSQKGRRQRHPHGRPRSYVTLDHPGVRNTGRTQQTAQPKCLVSEGAPGLLARSWATFYKR